MRLRNCVRAFVVGGIICGAASAQIVGGVVKSPAVYGIANSSCGAWLDAREAAKTNKNDLRFLQYEAFLDGFASAFNWYRNDTPSIGVFEGTDADARYASLDEACREYPSAVFIRGVVRVLRDLKASQYCVDVRTPCLAGTPEMVMPVPAL